MKHIGKYYQRAKTGALFPLPVAIEGALKLTNFVGAGSGNGKR
jgi:hypothetical protein